MQRRYSAPADSDPDNRALISISRDRIRLASLGVSPALRLKHGLPAYLQPFALRMTSIDIDYLFAKDALSIPTVPVRNALLRSYLEYVHPYLPLVNIHGILQTIQNRTGKSGRISLLLFQTIMFPGIAFVDMEILRMAGYSNRQAARKAFFQKVRVCFYNPLCYIY